MALHFSFAAQIIGWILISLWMQAEFWTYYDQNFEQKVLCWNDLNTRLSHCFQNFVGSEAEIQDAAKSTRSHGDHCSNFVLDKWKNQVFECLNLGYWKCFLLFLQCISTKFADRLSKFCGTFHQNCIAAFGRITFVLLHLYFLCSIGSYNNVFHTFDLCFHSSWPTVGLHSEPKL